MYRMYILGRVTGFVFPLKRCNRLFIVIRSVSINDLSLKQSVERSFNSISNHDIVVPRDNCIRSKSTRNTIFNNLRKYSSQIKTNSMKMPTSKTNEAQKSEFKRLPTNVKPLAYQISLKPNLDDFTFEGSEKIEIEVKNSTSNIIFNSADLKIKSASLVNKDGEVMVPKNIKLLDEEETASLEFSSSLPLGLYKLEMSFDGTLNDKMKGFYRSKYTCSDGQVKYSAVTQFESTDARRAFPCWDEPALKAVFDITLIAPRALVALSNMPEISRDPDPNCPGWDIVRFATTPVMSTYLLAVIVGHFDCVSGQTADKVLVRVFTPPGKAEHGRFALEVAEKVIPYYDDYFGIKYPLPKMDLVAISDFLSGAMENWGLVTYRESTVLVDPKETSSSQKQYIAVVIGHEIAHQWFGNLVTMEWWTDLWLNEGYATFTEFLCVDYLFPEYDIWSQFVVECLASALELDCLDSSHPIEVPVGHPSEINEIFDAISYNKGASIIRMLYSYLGEEDFKKGMNYYLTLHQYGNTHTEDLWAALATVSKKPVQKVMSTWTKQKGFPVVSVDVSQKDNKQIYNLRQEKFQTDLKKDDGTLWMIPISFSVDGKTISTVVMEDRTLSVELPVQPPGKQVKLNPSAVGFYRVKYPSGFLQQFSGSIQDLAMPPLDRFNLVDDLFALVKNGYSSTVDALSLLQLYVNEDNYTVWSSICANFSTLFGLLDYTDYLEEFKLFVRNILTPIVGKVGWEKIPNESHLNVLLRTLVLMQIGKAGDKHVIQEAKKKFEDHVSGSSVLLSDLRSCVYRLVNLAGDEKSFNSLIEMYKATDLQEEKARIGGCLGSVKDIRLKEETINFAMSDHVRAQDKVLVLVGITNDIAGRDLLWEFYKKNQGKFLEMYGSSHLHSVLVKVMCERFATEEKMAEVKQFFDDVPVPGCERNIQQAIESISRNIDWLKRDSIALKEFFQRVNK